MKLKRVVISHLLPTIVSHRIRPQTHLCLARARQGIAPVRQVEVSSHDPKGLGHQCLIAGTLLEICTSDVSIMRYRVFRRTASTPSFLVFVVISIIVAILILIPVLVLRARVAVQVRVRHNHVVQEADLELVSHGGFHIDPQHVPLTYPTMALIMSVIWSWLSSAVRALSGIFFPTVKLRSLSNSMSR